MEEERETEGGREGGGESIGHVGRQLSHVLE